ncbi:DUF4153 domain-containing protein [Pedobacter sandarakinus]|uniref:DUF4153 domain-containing protein n=1 Tax=Pedobacter sandarakinus TaxID=353156 RepID=UPI0022456CB6|nr:DUF4173 domain-containing protein [Pedobacter sandarakinus]MCX2574825.1 DUF4173 domain-containing protein [Pedobacter sandarakinus]
MKTKSNFLLLSTIVGGILFNLLFWSEKLGLNLFIYSVFVLIITSVNRDIAKHRKFIVYATLHLLAALLVIINNSNLSLAGYYISFGLFIGFSHYQQIRTVWMAFLATLLQIVGVPVSLVICLSAFRIGNFSLRPIFRIIRYIAIPIIILFVFTAIYSGANAIFGSYLDAILSGMQTALTSLFNFIFQDLSFERFIHICFGTALSGGLIITFYNHIVEKIELTQQDELERKKAKSKIMALWGELVRIFAGQITSKKLALKTEYIIGLISFSSLNLLIFVLNGIDILSLWFGDDIYTTANYAAELHDGTNALIFSIVLAMAIIIYFFRGNLNFYTKSQPMKILAIVWMIQNLILIISVLIRDAHYVTVYGLTYKRIGVGIFALLCIVGLVTVYVKVAQRKTVFYLLRINGNIWFGLLIFFSIFNWDIFITRYNLNHSETTPVDMDYLLSLSDKTLPILDENKNRLWPIDSNEAVEIQAKKSSANPYQARLDKRIQFFKERYATVSWLSWNLPDARTANYFGIKR